MLDMESEGRHNTDYRCKLAPGAACKLSGCRSALSLVLALLAAIRWRSRRRMACVLDVRKKFCLAREFVLTHVAPLKKDSILVV
jgi:hypothetical protein